MRFLLLISFTFFYFLPFCQETENTVKEKDIWTFSGYLKDLQWVRFDDKFRNAYATNLVHNRLNLNWKHGEHINGKIEVRNRFYWGDDVSKIPGFRHQLRNQNEFVDLSAEVFHTNSSLLHSNIERLWLEYRKEKWNLRAGRQRINWGITNTWNPNDLFNTYNFLDFDYEERPGSDAIKLHMIVNGSSNIELAIAGTNDKPITAMKYFTNYKGYDIQTILALYQESFTAGFGWAGSISDMGFKGEAQFYAGKKDSASQLNLTMEADYITGNGWYLTSALLFNQRGLQDPINNWTNIDFNTSPRNLMPAKWNFLAGTAKEFTPIFSGSMNLVFSPGVNMLILFPSFKYNLQTNLDLDLIWQSFFTELNKFKAISHTAFLRLRWSF